MHNTMGSTYRQEDGASMSRRGYSLWMGGPGGLGGLGGGLGGLGGTSLSYPGLNAVAYADDSPTTFHSPETSPLDHTLFPSSSMGDFSYVDPSSFGDFPPVNSSGTYPIGDVVPAFHGVGTGLSDHRYSITSAPSPSLYAPVAAGAMWQPAHASPATFLPTPPGADEDMGGDGDDMSNAPTPDDDDDDYLQPIQRRSKRQSGTTTTAPPLPPPPHPSTSSRKAKKRSAAQLRTASRAPRKKPNILPQRPTETEEDVKARAAHNQVEQEYRKRLNAHFERLLSVLPVPTTSVVGVGSSGSGGCGRRDGVGEKRLSKAEVLDLATERIQALERDMEMLEQEGRELRGRLAGCIV